MNNLLLQACHLLRLPFLIYWPYYLPSFSILRCFRSFRIGHIFVSDTQRKILVECGIQVSLKFLIYIKNIYIWSWSTMRNGEILTEIALDKLWYSIFHLFFAFFYHTGCLPDYCNFSGFFCSFLRNFQ